MLKRSVLLLLFSSWKEEDFQEMSGPSREGDLGHELFKAGLDPGVLVIVGNWDIELGRSHDVTVLDRGLGLIEMVERGKDNLLKKEGRKQKQKQKREQQRREREGWCASINKIISQASLLAPPGVPFGSPRRSYWRFPWGIPHFGKY